MRYSLALVAPLFVLLALLAPTLVFADDVADDNAVDHEPFDAILETYVDAEGRVDYAGLADDTTEAAKLDAYLAEIAEASPDETSREARLAFWINAYNALVIDTVLEEWPTEGPKEIEGFFDSETHQVAGRSMTLDTLEHDIIRPTFEEPRVHFVLVCAAESCPRLRREALTAENLEATLEAAAEEFIPRVTTLKEGAVITSKLFEWFSEDFTAAEGSVRAYLLEYIEDDALEAALKDEETSLKFRTYDWSINAQP